MCWISVSLNNKSAKSLVDKSSLLLPLFIYLKVSAGNNE